MKKLFLFLLLGTVTISYYSCSDESSPEQRQISLKTKPGLTSTEFAEASSLYATMSTSADYLDFYADLKDFTANFNGLQPAASTRDEWEEWGDKNIDQMNFVDQTDFMTQYDNVASKLNLVLSNNQLLFNHLENANPGQLINILHPTPIFTPEPITSLCYQGCVDAHSAAINLAVALYNAEMDNMDSVPNSPTTVIAKWVTKIAIQTAYNKIEADLATEFMNCVGGCPQ